MPRTHTKDTVINLLMLFLYHEEEEEDSRRLVNDLDFNRPANFKIIALGSTPNIWNVDLDSKST